MCIGLDWPQPLLNGEDKRGGGGGVGYKLPEIPKQV